MSWTSFETLNYPTVQASGGVNNNFDYPTSSDDAVMSPELGSKPATQLDRREQAIKSPPSSISDTSQQDGESNRGRRQDREESNGGKRITASGDEEDDQASPGANGQPRKRKRSRKGLDKKFGCPTEGCGKSYSRAEHLYRHQLNHTPKQIYLCDFPDCERKFVRQDLCARHRDRHTARGSHLQRKDSYMQHASEGGPVRSPPRSIHHEQSNQRFQPVHPPSAGNGSVNVGPYIPPLDTSVPIRPTISGPMTGSRHNDHSNSSTPVGEHYRSPQSYHTSASSPYGPMSHLNRSNSEGQYYHEAQARGFDPSATPRSATISNYDNAQRLASFGPMNPVRFQHSSSTSPQASRGPMHTSTEPTNFRTSATSAYTAPVSQNYSTQSPHAGHGSNEYQQFPAPTTLPPPVYSLSRTSPDTSQYNYSTTPTAVRSVETQNGGGLPGSVTVDTEIESGTPYAVPVFGTDEGLARSPFAMDESFAEWLFSDPHQNTSSPLNRHRGSMSIGATAFMENSPHMSGQSTANGQNGSSMPQQHAMLVTSILDPALPQTILSEEKRLQILELIEERFNETDYSPVRNQKDQLLEGDQSDDSHVLSLRMMQTYIGSYWYHFHPQMPILHKPTFSADKAQNLLLIAVIAIGASCLDMMHGESVTQAGDILANFLAWHLRGEIFMHADFRPPAKLWVFQSLLLLEIYEKMYSTRILHERAHIHHATTLTLMRRGSSLMGRSPLDSPPSMKDEKTGTHTNGLSYGAVADTPDTWWNHWITNEATRRVAFAAFVIDSIHTTMFGHSAIMVAHEMRLPLPCDETLWSATSGVEVGRIEASLAAEGIKSVNFLDSLKATLHGEPVQTNSFGRTAMMAGLLSVSWHLQQRDVQLRSLGVQSATGGKDIWRGSLTKAFDCWRSDFDHSVMKDERAAGSAYHHSRPGRLDEENIFESRTVLHHLAHMAMHVDIVQCQIFAKATRLLGRTITPSDYNSSQRKLREVWAPKASARDATFYALKFLTQVLTPDIDVGGMAIQPEYSARDDFLLNRPWVLYYSALIVWSYGYALDGPIQPPPTLISKEEQIQDMRSFMKRVGGVQDPRDLEFLKDRNASMGMLMILRDMFRKCRWELLHEAANLLTNCINMLKGTRRD